LQTGRGESGGIIDRMKKIVVLVSGRGSNMIALLDACARDACGERRWNAQVTAVVSDRAEAPACGLARERGVPLEVVSARAFSDRSSFDHALGERLSALDPDLVVLAGFMRILSPELVSRYQHRMLNIHPSLLPAFAGLHTHRRALASGTRIHGATVHYVSADLDAGPIIAQAALPVRDDEDETGLAARVLAAEHRILPRAVGWHLEGRLRVEGARVRLDSPRPDEEQWVWVP
jgi:phosphoribosylglycinamide formyltransferase-1